MCTERRQAGIDRVGVVASAATAHELGRGLFEGERGAVRPVREHRLGRVGHRDDARFSADIIADEPRGIPGAVDALVVLADDLRDGTSEFRAFEDLGADLGVSLDQEPLELVEFARLHEDLGRHRDLADVVQHGRSLDERDL